jgi:REP element-mobilizing transposase RayT
MSVWRRFDNHGYPSLITTNIESRRPVFNSSEAAKLLLRVISEVRHETRFQLLAFVIMPDHIHLVVAVPQGLTLGRVLRLIKGRFSNRYNRMRRSHGSVWQDRYHERALRSERELVAAIEYVHANPVQAGFTGQAESFSWSSANSAYQTDLDAYRG